MTIDVALRTATVADLPSIGRLAEDLAVLHHEALPSVFASASGSARDEPHWRESIDGEGRAALVAERDGVIIGFVTLALATETHSLLQPLRFARVNSVCVASHSRGQGVGRKLMQAAEAWSAEQGARELRLVVMAFNQAAASLYQELGYAVRSHTLTKPLSVQGEKGH